MSLKRDFDLSEGWQRARAAVGKTLDDIMGEARDDMIRVLKQRDKRATGDLIASMQKHVRSTLGGFRAMAGEDVKPGSSVTEGYGHWVDVGTRPHWVPLERNAEGHLTPKVLERWARAKFGATGEEKRAIAWGTARAIARRGTPAVRFVDTAWRSVKDDVVERLEKAVAEYILD